MANKNILKAGDRLLCPKCGAELICFHWEHRHLPVELQFQDEDDETVILIPVGLDEPDDDLTIEVNAELICPDADCGHQTGVFLDDTDPGDLAQAIRDGKIKVEPKPKRASRRAAKRAPK